MKFSFYSKKNSWSQVSLLISTFILSVSFFRTATAESADARKAYSRGPPLYFVPPWNRLAPEVTQRTKKCFYPATERLTESCRESRSSLKNFRELRWCYTMTISTTTIFSAMQHYNIARTLFRMVATLFQQSNAVLREKLSLRIVSCSITFRANHKE